MMHKMLFKVVCAYCYYLFLVILSVVGSVSPPCVPNHLLFQDGFDNDVDALLEEGMPVPKKMRVTEDKYTADSDHQSDGDGEGGVQPMVTKIKTVLKSEWRPRLKVKCGSWTVCIC